MTFETLLKCGARLISKRPPKLIAGSFFSLGMVIVLSSYLTRDASANLLLHLLAALGVSLAALGLRWIEKRCPDPRNESRANR